MVNNECLPLSTIVLFFNKVRNLLTICDRGICLTLIHISYTSSTNVGKGNIVGITKTLSFPGVFIKKHVHHLGDN